MKKYMIAMVLVVFTGCAHTSIVAWKDHEIEVCGNKYSDRDDIIEMAKGTCHGDATVVSIMNRSHTHKNTCYVFQCKDISMAKLQMSSNY